MIRLILRSFSFALILLVAATCRTNLPTRSPANDQLSTIPTRSPIKDTQTDRPSTALPTPPPAANRLQPTPTLTSTTPPLVAAPDILTPSTISALEQIGLIQYSPWDLVLATAWSPNGNLIAAAAGESIYIYSRDLKEQSKLEVGSWTTSLAFHPQGLWLASGGRDGNIQIWDVQKQSLILRLAAHKKGVNAVAFSPAGSILASAGNDAVARLWDPVTGEKLAQMIGGTYAVPSIAFSPDGAELAITNGELIRIRDVETGRFAHTLRSEGSNYSTAWSPDGDVLAAGNTSGDISLWDVSLKQSSGSVSPPVVAFTGPASMVWSLDFSPDGALLAASDNYGTIYIWDVEGKNLVFSHSSNPQGVTSLAFSPDGRYLVTGGLDGALRLWASR